MKQPAEPVPAIVAAEATQEASAPLQAQPQPARASFAKTDAESTNGPPPPLEEAMRGFVSVVLTTLEERSEAAMASMLAEVVAQQVSTQLPPLMQDEVSAHLAAAISREQLLSAAEKAVQKELPTLANQIAASIETKVRQHLTDRPLDAPVTRTAARGIEPLLSSAIIFLGDRQDYSGTGRIDTS